MAVNIKDGRRTVIAEPEWFPRPDGMERAVVFQPGFNSDPNPDKSKNYGVHGMEIAWYLRGPKGAVQFVVYTEWIPGKLSPGHGLLPRGYAPRPPARYPSGAGIGYHAPVPQYEGQETYRRDDCTLLDGAACYYDESLTASDALAKEFTEHGEPVIWKALEGWYADLKDGAP